MLFNSPQFIFLFLPITLALFYALAFHASFRTALSSLVLCSLLFYGVWNPPYLILLMFSIGVNFQFGNCLRQRVDQAGKTRALLFAGVAFNLCLIAYYKYANFFVSAVGDISGHSLTLEQIVLPLGISFFTFQQITWLVDTCRGNARRFDLLEYTQFVTFFPQLIAGPIVHHHEMMPQFNRQNMLSRIPENIAVGLTLFLLGLFKKVVLADALALHATPVFSAAESGVVLTIHEAWVGALAYSLQLYFDFSGYSDMAIGLARLFGITLPMNFDSPYKSVSIIDFWRRWHMTLSRFLRDYVYIPLGGSHQGAARRYINMGLTMLLGGLWHGAGWTFILWGGLHGVFLAINHGWRNMKARTRSSDSPPEATDDHLTHAVATGSKHFSVPGNLYAIFSGLLSHVLTLTAVVTAWVVFRAESMEAAVSQLRSMFGLNGIALPASLQGPMQTIVHEQFVQQLQFGKLFGNELLSPASAIMWVGLTGAIALAAPNSQQLLIRYRPVLEPVRTINGLAGRLQWAPDLSWCLLISAVALYTQLHLTNVSEFLYFQF